MKAKDDMIVSQIDVIESVEDDGCPPHPSAETLVWLELAEDFEASSKLRAFRLRSW